MSDEPPTGHSEHSALAMQVEAARGKLPLQHDTALYEALSDREIAAERELAEWIRAKRRKQRKRAVADELGAERRDRRVGAALRRSEEADARWHRKALAARRRAASPDARLAQLYRRAEWSSRALIAVVLLGMVWAGVNVQHNLVPSGDMSNPLYWLSYGIEAMISIPIVVIMVAATTAARWGRELERGKVLAVEVALLTTTIALNTAPHVAAADWGRAAEYAIAPIMVGVVIWLHAWVAARYATLIDAASVLTTESHREYPADTAAPVPASPLPRTVLQQIPPSSRHDSAALRVDMTTGGGGSGRTSATPAGEVAVETPESAPEPRRHRTDIAGQPVDTGDPHAQTGQPLDSGDGHNEAGQPLATNDSHDETRQPLATNDSHDETGQPLTTSHRYVRDRQPLDIRDDHDEGADVGRESELVDRRYLGTLHAVTPPRTVGPAEPNPHTPKPDSTGKSEDATAPISLQLIRAAARDTPRRNDLLPLSSDRPSRTPHRTVATPAHVRATESAGELPTVEPVPEAAVHAGTVARPSNGDTTERTAAAAEVPEQLMLSADPDPDTAAATTARTPARGTEPRQTPSRPVEHPETPDPVPESNDPADPMPDYDELAYEETQVRTLARQIATRSPLRLTIDQIEEILELTDQSWPPQGISAEVGVPGKTVATVIDFARKLQDPLAYTG